MIRTSHRNRNGLEVIFQEVENGFVVSCPDSSYARRGIADNGDFSFWDPEGGPFIHVGDHLSEFAKGLPDLEIKAIEQHVDGSLLITK